MSSDRADATPVPAQSPKTLRDHLMNLAGAAVIVFVTLMLIEILLRAADPWGLYYFQDLEVLGNSIFTPDAERGYVMPDGAYTFTRWQAEMRDGGRVVPATNATAACTIAILGDSVAFGYGVNDAETWVNVAAQSLAGVRLLNLGVPRYNSTNVVGTWRAYNDADAYLYLVITNDLDTALDVETQRFVGGGTGQSWLVRYANFALYRGGGTDQIDLQGREDVPPLPDDYAGLARLWGEIKTLATDARVTFAAFEKEPLTSTLLARDLPLTVLTYPFNRRNSVADYHLNPTGNAELAAQVVPLLQDIATERCPAAQS